MYLSVLECLAHIDEQLRPTKVKPNYTFPFTSALSQYVVRGYKMTTASPVQGDTRTHSPHWAGDDIPSWLASIPWLVAAVPQEYHKNIRIFWWHLSIVSFSLFQIYPCKVQAGLVLSLTQIMRNCSSRGCRKPNDTSQSQPGACSGLAIWAGTIFPGFQAALH